MVIRPMTRYDIDFFRHEFDTDSFQKNLDIQFETYEGYFLNKFEKCESFMIIENGNAVGFYSFNNLISDFPSVTCYISKDATGKGLIPRTQDILFNMYDIEEIYAEVLQGNENAEKMFTNYGFKLVRDQEWQKVFKWERSNVKKRHS